jgi:hypothetical protein
VSYSAEVSGFFDLEQIKTAQAMPVLLSSLPSTPLYILIKHNKAIQSSKHSKARKAKQQPTKSPTSQPTNRKHVRLLWLRDLRDGWLLLLPMRPLRVQLMLARGWSPTESLPKRWKEVAEQALSEGVEVELAEMRTRSRKKW